MGLRLIKNEEDTKLKMVVDYLRDKLGFADDELFYEESFSFTIGRYDHPVNTSEDVRQKKPRLDILIKRDGKNLCVVEVKDVKVPIRAKDINQAVSYARLLDQIAPICIITNGNIWKLVDTITKKEISKETLPDLDYIPSLPQGAYYDALQHFFGYSVENVLAFCSKQVESFMTELKGGAQDRYKKYIPDLYEPRKGAERALNEFLQSNASCFVVVDDAGSGKTCWVCHSALSHLTQEYATFFYHGHNVEQGIFQAINEDLNWTFSSQYDVIQGFKRLVELFKDKKILIFIDQLDGMAQSEARRVLDDFVRRVDGTRVKLIATCKPAAWDALLERDGIPTLLALKVFQVRGDKGYQLEAFDDQEFHTMLEKYRRFYQYDGLFETDVYEACRQNPFLLRIMFEVASDKRWPYINYSSIEFYDAYYDILAKRFNPDRDMTERILVGVAQCLYNHDCDELDRDVIFDDLHLSQTETLPTCLFELNVLKRVRRNHATYISFYFTKLRDYLIAFRALKWHSLSSQAFSQRIAGEVFQSVRLEVLNLYYAIAEEEHKRVLDGLVYENAKQFVLFYEQLINENFSTFKSAFPPNTTGPIGLAGYLDLSGRGISYRGFRPLKNPGNRVLLFPRSLQRTGGEIGNLAYLHGSERQKLTHSAKGFREIDIKKEAIWQEIWPSLQKIIKDGILDESQNKDLLIERVLAIVLCQYKEFFQLAPYATRDSYFPLQLDALREFVLYKIARRALENRIIEKREGLYQIEEEWVGGIQHTILQFTPAQWAEIDSQAWSYAKAGTDLSSETHFAPRYNYGPFLLRDLDDLARLGVAEINNSPLAAWYDRKRIETPYQWDDDRFSLLERFVVHFYLSYLKEYQILVEKNFPTLCQEFVFYKRLPLKLSVAVERDSQYLTRRLAYPFTILVLQHTEVGSPSNSVTLSTSEEIEKETDKLRASNIGYLSRPTISGSSFLMPRSSHVPLEGIDKRFCLLREAVYSRLIDDLEEAFLKFAVKHGAPPDDTQMLRKLQRMENNN